MAWEADKARGLGAGSATPSGGVPLLSNRSEGPDFARVGDAMRPLAELCLAPGAETPFALGLIGGRGAGKSFALRRLIDRIESLAQAASGAGAPAFLSKVVIARVDALAVSSDGAGAIAAAVFSALAPERDGAPNYAQLADEAAHATSDPRQAASAAVERHDETARRLEQERSARDEVEAKRARIVEALLYDTPGSRIDAFARAGRAKIEGRMRSFGFTDGDANANFRSLVRDMAGLGPSGRVGVFVRSIWSYGGQAGLLLLAILAFALAVILHWLTSSGAGDALSALSAQLAPALDWVKAHDETLKYTTEALIVLGFVSLFANLWRAARFTSLLFRGVRLLNLDIAERRRELDATAARLERRVAALQLETDAAHQRAENLARRAGGGAAAARPPGPRFARPMDDAAAAARDFMSELARVMSAGAVPAPQRLLVVIDNVDLLPPAEARRLLDVATQMIGPGAALVVACDPGRWGEDASAIAERLFELVFDVTALAASQSERLAAGLLAPPTPAAQPEAIDSEKSALAEPLGDYELRLLTSLSALIGNPRATKRFLNAYRLARLGAAPRSAVIVCLAALMSCDRSLALALRWALFSQGGRFDPSLLPPQLASAVESAGLIAMEPAAVKAAFAAARVYAPWSV
jgi:hypothetical protein